MFRALRRLDVGKLKSYLYGMESESESAVVKRVKMSTEHPPGDPSSASTSKVVPMEDPEQAERGSKEGSTPASSFPKKNEVKEYSLSIFEFDNLIRQTTYVDKTLFIKAFFEIENVEVPLITAPRRFGKTSIMDMLRKFVEIKTDEDGKPFELKVEGEGKEVKLKAEQDSPNFRLFTDKKIFEHKDIFIKHFGRYPVINVDFKQVVGNSYEEILQQLRYVVFKSFQEHEYLAESKVLSDISKVEFNNYCGGYRTLDESQIAEGLEHLSFCLFKHFQRKAFVFIDEYDVPVFEVVKIACKEYSEANKVSSKAAEENSEAAEMKCVINRMKCIDVMMCSLLKSNKYIANALLTGCHHVKNIFSPHANNIEHIVALQSNKFCRFYGFSGEEVKKLLEDHNLSGRLNEVQEWYNGYKKMFDNGNSIEIYCNASILRYLDQKKADCYWSSGAFAWHRMILRHYQIFDKCREILTGKTVEIKYAQLEVDEMITLNNMIYRRADKDISKKEVDLFVQFLYENGYLNVVASTCNRLTLEVPNHEIREVFANTIYTVELVTKWFKLKQPIIERFLEAFAKVMREGTEESFDALANCTKDLFEGRVPVNEFELHAVVYTVLKFKLPYSKVYAEVRPSLESKYRCDIVATAGSEEQAKKIGVVLEFMFGDRTDSQAALKRIVEQKYYDALEGQQIVDRFLIGLHMAAVDGKTTITYLKNSTDIRKQLTRESS